MDFNGQVGLNVHVDRVGKFFGKLLLTIVVNFVISFN